MSDSVASVSARIEAVWQTCVRDRTVGYVTAERFFDEVLRIFADHHIDATPDELRTVRWLCGWESTTLANVVTLIVRGRS